MYPEQRFNVQHMLPLRLLSYSQYVFTARATDVTGCFLTDLNVVNALQLIENGAVLLPCVYTCLYHSGAQRFQAVSYHRGTTGPPLPHLHASCDILKLRHPLVGEAAV